MFRVIQTLTPFLVPSAERHVTSKRHTQDETDRWIFIYMYLVLYVTCYTSKGISLPQYLRFICGCILIYMLYVL